MTKYFNYGPTDIDFGVDMGAIRAVVFAGVEPDAEGRWRVTGDYAAVCPSHGSLIEDVPQTVAALFAYDHNNAEHDGAMVDTITPGWFFEQMRTRRRRERRLLAMPVIALLIQAATYEVIIWNHSLLDYVLAPIGVLGTALNGFVAASTLARLAKVRIAMQAFAESVEVEP